MLLSSICIGLFILALISIGATQNIEFDSKYYDELMSLTSKGQVGGLTAK